MRELSLLIGQIFFIAILQTVLELFLEKDKRDDLIKIINIACIIGSLYLLLQFVFNHMWDEITSFVNLPF